MTRSCVYFLPQDGIDREEGERRNEEARRGEPGGLTNVSHKQLHRRALLLRHGISSSRYVFPPSLILLFPSPFLLLLLPPPLSPSHPPLTPPPSHPIRLRSLPRNLHPPSSERHKNLLPQPNGPSHHARNPRSRLHHRPPLNPRLPHHRHALQPPLPRHRPRFGPRPTHARHRRRSHPKSPRNERPHGSRRRRPLARPTTYGSRTRIQGMCPHA